MTPEDRIEALEKRVDEMKIKFTEAVDLMQFLGGSERVFQAVALALIACHPDRSTLREFLHKPLEMTATNILFGSESQAHAQGAQAAHDVVLEYVNKP